MPQFGFQRLEVYQLAKALVLKSYQLTKTTAKDKSHFLNMAYSSMMELVCQYEISKELGYITDEELEDMTDSAYRLSVKISHFREAVGGRP